ncbi:MULTISPECIES: acyl-CoA dehydrogenase family protein [Pseudonocardia]|uniref:glutaryl-CoA dehydrogenase (ETF) n=2 Tax=Pseudonocardia TaxID=1847 RepID=A0A1Y2NAV1_PSEAH|nr:MULTISPECIES: acyl-CoA dehydrogenase family protein [Pseudonocardia]OSY44207.1 Acyl-CoA dehydrogenase, short-chain specific [Pseudonocardia autotrophica]TDN74063.1 glutaryl-CoA dehydrogenase [Pseudonocardia autotrophica]BBG04821.1 acyl-CoA dehydrogenase [Pseudonocardia autotrophica]GEC23477.1 acyl-CoA dehydrogenase [Pseudonocardia saturnea]
MPDPHDLLDLDGLLSGPEREWRDEVRRFTTERITPHVADWFERAHFPRDLLPELGRRGLLGMHLHGPGCPGRGAVEYGLAAMELEAADSGIRTVVSVQGSLAMTAIDRFGSPEQRERWLPPMAAGELIGCFGLTEPEAGSDPSGMRTRAEPDGDGWVLHGAKRWIGLATVADIAIIWARTPDGIRGFVVPTATPGFSATPIEPKLGLRTSVQADVVLDGVRLTGDALLPGALGLRGPFTCLDEARYGIMWGAMGAARDAWETALAYTGARRQFGTPLAAFQLTQQKLVDMMLEIQKGTLVALRTGRLKDAGRLRHEQISIGKLNNVREAIEVCRTARTLLGGNGMTAEYPPLRHATNLEAVRTYEGTDEIHTLILGRALTGIPAFTAGSS